MSDSIYIKLNNKELEYFKKISNITLTDYKIKGDFITIENLINALEDLVVEYDVLQEKGEQNE